MPDDDRRPSGRHPAASTHAPAYPSSPAVPRRAAPARAPAAPSGGLPGLPAPPAAPPLRVVVADDNPVVRAGLTALLSGRDDIEVVAEAADGRQAYEAAAAHRPDVVLLDVRMPGVDGISALPHLVRIAPVMMLTYSRESEIVQAALRLGAGGYLVHGEFTADQLVAAVRDVRSGRAHFTATAADALLAHVRGGSPLSGADRTPPLPDGLGTARSTSRHQPVTEEPKAAAPAHGAPPRELPASRMLQRLQALPTEENPHPQNQNPSHVQPDMGESASGAVWANGSRPSRREDVKDRYGLSHREVEVMELISSGMTNAQIAAACFISEKTVKNHINRIFTKLQAASRSEAIAIWLGTARGGTTGHG